MDYADIRAVHIASVAVSIALFMLRAVLTEIGLNWRRWACLRIAPHLNDTVLLSAAITLVTMSGQTPWALPWLGAKMVALLAYIGLGRIALRDGVASNTRRICAVLAILAVAFIVCVALTRSATLNLFPVQLYSQSVSV